MHRVVLQEVACIVKGEEGVGDGHRHEVGIVLEGGVVDKAADVAKTVYSNLNSHG